MTPQTLTLIITTFKDVDITSKTFDLTTLFNGLSPDDRVAKLRAWAIAKVGGDDKFAKQFDHAHRRWLARELLGGWPESVSDMVELYVEQRKIAVGFNGLLSSPYHRRETLNLATVERDLRLIAGRIGVPFDKSAVSDAVEKFITTAKDRRIRDSLTLLDGAKGTIEAEAEWDRFVSAWADTSPEKGSAVYVKRLLQTTMWQIKRRLADDPAFPVHAHLMTVICGPQGTGKTNLVRKLVEPISDLMCASDFKKLTEGKDLALPLFPIVFLDEMESAERSDVEAIKNAITRDTVTIRLMRTNGNATERSRNVFIGCTNGTLGDKITDTTGQRRFGPCHTRHAPHAANIAAGLDVVDWEALNSVDVLALWCSVDWRAEHPLQSDPEAKAEWLRLIEAERNQSNVEAWLRSLNGADFYGAHDGLTTRDLFTRPVHGYRDWCKEHGYGPGSEGKLGREMKKHIGQPWYPFLAPRNRAKGTVHLFRDGEDIAANVTPLFAAKAQAMANLRQHLGGRGG